MIKWPKLQKLLIYWKMTLKSFRSSDQTLNRVKNTTFDQLKFDFPRIPGIPWGPRFTCLTESRSWNFLFILFINLTFFIYYSIHVSYLKNKTLPLQCRGLRWIFVFVFHHVKIELSPSIRACENHCDLVKMKSHQFLMRKSFSFFLRKS